MIGGRTRYRKSLANRARHLMLRQIAFQKKHKQRLICKAQGIAFIRYPCLYKKCIRDKHISKVMPSKFEVLTNQDEVFAFVAELLDMHSNRRLKEINLDLTDVQTIDSAAICLLLSVVCELSNYGIKVTGNYPKRTDCAKFFIESGFLNHMKDSHGKNFAIEVPNLIVEAGTNKTRNKDIAQAVRKASGFLLGSPQRYQPAYTVAMEICSNSVEHAYIERPKHWRLGICYVDDHVSFTMTDTGTGILKTLHRKFLKEIKDTVTLKDNSDILYRAFLRKYGSSTQLVNRNKGLPCILDKFNSGLIKNLKVITNDVYLDFNNIKEKHKMNNPFSGVLFYWEVDNECIDNFVNNIKI